MTLPVALTTPSVSTLPPVMLAVALTVPILEIVTFPTKTFPTTSNLALGLAVPMPTELPE